MVCGESESRRGHRGQEIGEERGRITEGTTEADASETAGAAGREVDLCLRGGEPESRGSKVTVS